MPNLVFPSAVLLALAPAASTELPRIDATQFAQLTIHQRIVIRIPRVLGGRRDPRADPLEQSWTAKKGPKCVPLGALEGAIIAQPDSVDLLIADGTRLRAELDDDCPSLDFYSGLYIKGTSDGMVCADRDSIRSRSGSQCKIDKFRRLVAKR
jgi:hypothetical protein